MTTHAPRRCSDPRSGLHPSSALTGPIRSIRVAASIKWDRADDPFERTFAQTDRPRPIGFARRWTSVAFGIGVQRRRLGWSALGWPADDRARLRQNDEEVASRQRHQ